MAQRNIVTGSKHDNRLFDLVAAYCAACAETARLSDRDADVDRHFAYCYTRQITIAACVHLHLQPPAAGRIGGAPGAWGSLVSRRPI